MNFTSCARYYDPKIGRFISRDPVKGVLTNPQSQNPYAYALNNPVNLTDPSGEFVGPLLQKCAQLLCGGGDCMNEARALGQIGEKASRIVTNSEQIKSLSNTANFRVPDQLLHSEQLLGEVKNVSNLSLTKQINDFVMYTQEVGYQFDLWVREITKLSQPLQEIVNEGLIILQHLPGL